MSSRLTVALAALVHILVASAEAAAVTIPPEAKEIVTFIFVRNATGQLQPNGTAFFVGVKAEQNPDQVYGYLVTAKHVIRDKAGRYFPEIFIRLNRRSGDAEIRQIPLTGKDSIPIHTHHDPDVDLAVLPLLPDPQAFDFKLLPAEMVTTPEIFKQANIRDGDDVFFTGLFWHFLGAQRNYPIVRFGRVAMVTHEKVPWTGKMLDLYLVEAQAFGGNSGAPVFFYLGGGREAGTLTLGRRLLLAGVVKGSFLEAHEIKVIEREKALVGTQNAGITAVVPAHKLHEILFSRELRAARAGRK